VKAAVIQAAAAALTACLGAAFLMLAMPAEAAPQPSRAAMAEFKRMNPCPATGEAKGACPGYVVAHVQPLCADGEDAVGNMQWQTMAESRVHGRWARQYCQFRRGTAAGRASTASFAACGCRGR